MDWYLTQKGAQIPKNKHINTYLLAACRDMRSSQSMVELHSLMSTYNIETMLCSHSIFNYCNTHNGLVSDQKGCSKPPKQACLHWLTACHDVKLTQSMVELHSFMSIYNVETMLASRFIFNNGNTHNGPDVWSKRVIRDPKKACLHLLAACVWYGYINLHNSTVFTII